MLSSPAKAGDPVRRGFSVLSLAALEYWVTRRSLSSGGHSADPVAGDDNWMCVRHLAARCARALQVIFATSRKIKRAQGMPDARCTRGPVRSPVVNRHSRMSAIALTREERRLRRVSKDE